MRSKSEFKRLQEMGFIRSKDVKITNKKLKRNRCRCTNCNTIIESKHVHDFVSCKCGKIFTDGGLDCVRRGFEDPSDIEDLNEFE